MFETPILFLIFNRPDTTEQVFECIRQIKPSRLYVAADGARRDRAGEEERCRQTRSIIDNIDWDCELKTLYREENLGCKLAVSTAITWFFEQEEYGIILEDDCLPDLSFFPYCEELLVRYKDDKRIGHISGNNFFPGIVSQGDSYNFCTICHIWGWASWRRVWKNYDVDFTYWQEAQTNKNKRESLFNSLREEIYFFSFISDTLAGNKGIDTWDVQYFFMLRLQHQLSIYPCVNMVSNIGLNTPDSTHMSSKRNKKFFVNSSAISLPQKHPVYILSNKRIDEITIRKRFFSYKRLLRYIIKKIL